MHSDVLFYMFYFTSYPNDMSDEDYKRRSMDPLQRKIVKNTVDFFMNFAKFK